jgi:hypothetical protein
MWNKLSEPKGFQKFKNRITFTKSKKEIVGGIIDEYCDRAFEEIINYKNDKTRTFNLIDNYLILANELSLGKTIDDFNNELDSLKKGIDTIIVQLPDTIDKNVLFDHIEIAKNK